jgi:ubiquinone/menaquinone biosynthesis C-methylase UbiE
VKSKDLFPAVFSRHAEAYQQRLESIMSRGEARGRMRAIELVGARPGMRVIDLACGPGNLTRMLAARVSPGGEVVGVDLAAGMIELARAANTPNARFEVMDIEHLDFPPAAFDVALCGHGFQFVPDLPRALGEARRVIRAGGRLAASVPASPVTDRAPARPTQSGTVWEVLDSVIDRWLPPPTEVVDQQTTRSTVRDKSAFEQAALAAGFATAAVEVVEEEVRWASAEQVVSLFASWWDCASRLDGVDPDRRQAFLDDAVTTLKRDHPGPIVTTGRNHVLLALA